MELIRDQFIKKRHETIIVSGYKLKIVRICIGFSILWTALKITRSPLEAFSFIRSLLNERKKLHNNSGEIKAVKSGGKYYWSMNLPGWPSHAFNEFIYNEVRRINNPGRCHLQTVILAITNTCPLNCEHCYESDNLSDTNKLKFNELKVIIRNIREAGINHIHLSGGEPLNRFEDMIELMKFSGDNCDYWINTSGFGLTSEKAVKMKQCGMTGAIISLDNWDEDLHNSFRKNPKSYKWVKEAVKNCNEAGIIVCLSICPTKDFVTEENLNRYHNLAKDLGVAFIRIFEPRQAGRFVGKNALLTETQVKLIVKFMISHNRNKLYSEFPIIMFSGHHQRESGCLGAGNRYIYIDANGEFHSCPFCRNSLGSALKMPISEGIIRARAEGCHVFKQRIIV